MGCYPNGKRFVFCQNKYILRTSCILGGGTDGKYVGKEQMMLETIVSIVVTIISIIVTIISILQTEKKHKQQKSNRPSPKE
jgi:hypothetical protein